MRLTLLFLNKNTNISIKFKFFRLGKLTHDDLRVKVNQLYRIFYRTFYTLSSSMFLSILIHVYVNVIFYIGKEKHILSVH
jgi:hypothetical protein